ncbi:MAG: hypothetical protein JXJ22_14430 [Bacteroidales bacterium]|nr:hypothetical protein [Bacteroidales bacterium]
MKDLTKDHAEIVYDENLKTLKLIYKSQISADEFIQVNQQFIDVFKSLDTNKIFVDARVIKVVPVKSQQWIVQHMMPELIKHVNGNKLYHVQILNKDAFVQYAAKSIKSQTEKNNQESPMEIAAFTDEQEGIDWLVSQN